MNSVKEMDIYTYLFRNPKEKTLVEFNSLEFNIKSLSKDNEKVYEIYGYARIIYNMENYSGYTRIFSEKNIDLTMKILDTLNKFHHINFNIIESCIISKGVNLMTVSILNDLKIPFTGHGYTFVQEKIPKNNIELLKSNTYYYSKYVNQVKDNIAGMTMNQFSKFLKKIYKDDFEKKEYLKDISELKKFNVKLVIFMREKANIENKECFQFFYKRMENILEDLNIQPKLFIKFY